MFYKDVENLKPPLFKRLTGVKKEVFLLMHDSVTSFKQEIRKHVSRGRPPKLTYADKILLMLMYYREYRSQFHIGVAYGIAESTVCEIISEMENILIQDKRFHLPGKKVLRENTFEVVLVDVTESPVERPKKNSGEIIQAKRNVTLKKHK
jgi:Helix-turn-helix of DDE superfamily endonuclease